MKSNECFVLMARVCLPIHFFYFCLLAAFCPSHFTLPSSPSQMLPTYDDFVFFFFFFLFSFMSGLTIVIHIIQNWQKYPRVPCMKTYTTTIISQNYSTPQFLSRPCISHSSITHCTSACVCVKISLYNTQPPITQKTQPLPDTRQRSNQLRILVGQLQKVAPPSHVFIQV